ncbi:MerR family transcriptional regulator [Oerskovia turbata]|uniref:MerR family transcriptional regulator n=1 Tax=Oerskovia turbata TaxID=1713 RepID=A0A4Q1KJP2_9CELL|nr:MerR family transcriptional regulator [Oerskovia turbata]RXR27396.1 MerR family transcriptional regulator [Oerskovia turbata]RXR30053.1 MerR family transcriptional regulator [Oerskovia turbata]
MTSLRSAPNPGGPRRKATEAPALAVAAVAKRLGVAPATLRTWDRRYGLGPSEHTAGSHRRYTADDVARLVIMRRLTLEGVAPVDAARAALDADETELAREIEDGDSDADDADRTGGPDDGDGDGDPEPGADPSPAPDSPSGGVRLLRSVPRAADDEPVRLGAPRPTSVSDVVDAAIAFDQKKCDQLLRIAPGTDPGHWWSTLVEPALHRIAERTFLASPGEMPEVVFSNATLAALREYTHASEEALVAGGGPPPNHPSRMRRIVLIFAAPGEQVPLAAHALAAALGAQGAMARIVTGSATAHRSLELVTMVRPAAIAVVTMQPRPVLDVVHTLHEANPDLPIFVGLANDEAAASLPYASTVQRVRSFTGLLHEALAVVR